MFSFFPFFHFKPEIDRPTRIPSSLKTLARFAAIQFNFSRSHSLNYCRYRYLSNNVSVERIHRVHTRGTGGVGKGEGALERWITLRFIQSRLVHESLRTRNPDHALHRRDRWCALADTTQIASFLTADAFVLAIRHHPAWARVRLKHIS